jgi:periplasmic protein TonB
MSTQTLENHLPPANDRMVTTLFLAALLHGIVILGVTFSSPGGDADSDQAPGLEVILVNDGAQSAKRNAKARYLAQRNQEGSGNTLSPDRALIPKSSLAPAMRPGAANGDGVDLHQAGREAGDAQTLATLSRSTRIVYFAAAAAAQDTAELPLLLEKRPDFGMDPNDDGVELRLRGESKNQLWISADTRESVVAVYLDRWRRKVERVGTLNFPDAARREKMTGTPVVEVTITANGRLERAIIRRSSGHSEIDDAAIRILKLAAPFDSFPHELSAKHDQIRIAYEWQFLGGEDEGSRVFYSEP